MKIKRLLASGLAALLAASLLAVTGGAETVRSVYGTSQNGSVSGVSVKTRTQSEIVSYINSHKFNTSSAPAYSVQPDLATPFTNSGTLNSASLSNGLNALNVMRYIAGLDEVSLSSEYSSICQDAAYIGALNNSISHSPAKPSGLSDNIYTTGKTGCGSSNLALGYTNTAAAVLGFMDDSNNSNIDRLGHRRWCLNPAMKKTGFGQVNKSEAMYSFDNGYGTVPEYGVVWPAQNMPVDYFGGGQAWSYSLGERISDQNSVKVTLKRISDSRKWTFSKASSDGYFNIENSNYGKPGCVIFRPDNITYSAGDKFEVTITGLAKPVNYTVTFFSLSAPSSAKPDTVTGLKATSTRTNSISLSWTGTDTADSYQVDIYKDGKWTKLTKTAGTSCTASGLTAATKYKFRVFSFKGTAYSTAASISVTTAESSSKPQTVSGLKASSTTIASITLTWNRTTTADSYQVDIYKDGKWTKLTKITGNICTAGGLSPSTSYQFRVFSFKGTEYSSPAKLTVSTKSNSTSSTKPQTVTNLRPTSVTAAAIELSWTGTTGADSYQVDICKDGKWSKLTKTTEQTCKVAGLSASTTYSFRVFAFKGTAYSSAATLTVCTKGSSGSTGSTGSSGSSQPQTVTGLKVDSVSPNSVVISWDKTNTADSYQVDIFKDGKWSMALKTTGDRCMIAGLSSRTSYSVKVFSFKGSEYSSPAIILVTTE